MGRTYQVQVTGLFLGQAGRIARIAQQPYCFTSTFAALLACSLRAGCGEARAAMSRQRRANGEEDALLAQQLNQQQHLNARKERELAELRRALKSEELELDRMTKRAGARGARGGAETGAAIRRCLARREASLHDTLHRMQVRLDHDEAKNRALRQQIDDLRQARLNHHSAMKIGESEINRSTREISETIVAAQRAYAERETCLFRQKEL